MAICRSAFTLFDVLLPLFSKAPTGVAEKGSNKMIFAFHSCLPAFCRHIVYLPLLVWKLAGANTH